jgi:hypothetical protein
MGNLEIIAKKMEIMGFNIDIEKIENPKLKSILEKLAQELQNQETERKLNWKEKGRYSEYSDKYSEYTERYKDHKYRDTHSETYYEKQVCH